MKISPRLVPSGVVMVTVAFAVACGNPASATRAGGQLRPATTVPDATTATGGPPGSRPAPTSPTTIRPSPAPGASTTTTTATSAQSGVAGTVLFGPVCPVERIPPDPQCAPRPGPADVQLLRPDGSVAAQARTGADGRFAVAVAAGPYRVRATPVAGGPGRGCQAEPAQVSVVSGSFASVAVTCDTGIR